MNDAKIAAAQAGSPFPIAAFEFAHFAMDRAIAAVGRRRHILAAEFVKAWVQEGIEQFGCCASAVFREWGVTSGEDLGSIVFRLIEVDAFQKDADDRAEDFAAVHDLYLSFLAVCERTHIAALVMK